MALRDQPYLPLYVQDFLTDEKLIECSAESTGVYIRLLCIMHKSDEYGTVLLKQKDKQNSNTCLNFAYKLSKQMPWQVEVIKKCLEELVDEKVIQLDDDMLVQKRMVKDNDISLKRSSAGKKGGGNPNFVNALVKTKPQTNSEDENENVNRIDYELYINEWNNHFPDSKVLKLNEDRKRKIKTRIKNDSDFDKHFIICLTKIQESNWLSGVSSGWKASFDWIIANDTNYLKVLEDQYENKKGNEDGETREISDAEAFRSADDLIGRIFRPL